MQDYVKCWNCRKEQYMPYDSKCTGCGKEMELEKENMNDKKPIKNRDDSCSICGKPFVNPHDPCRCYGRPSGLPKGFDEPMQEVHCYDCLRTKGFSTTISLVILGVIFTIALATGYIIIPENFDIIVFFSLFWIGLVGIAGITIPSYIASRAIRDYCNKSKPNEYKQTFNVIIFGLCTAFALIVTVLAVLNITPNYDWWIVRDCEGISYCERYEK